MRTVLLPIVILLAVVTAVTAMTVAQTTPVEPGISDADRKAITATALDYCDGWYTGDPERMNRALHADLAKRIAVDNPESGATELQSMTAAHLTEMTSKGYGTKTPAEIQQRDVRVLDVFGNAATVRLEMHGWVDYMHMAKCDGRWVIVNVLWAKKSLSEM